MNFIESYLFPALGVATFFLWFCSVALCIRLRAAQGKSVAQAILLGILLGPLGVVFVLMSYRRGQAASILPERHVLRSARVVSLSAVIAGLVSVISCMMAAFFLGKIVFDFSGELIQFPVAIGIAVGSFIGGLAMAFFGQRIAVIESLVVLALISWLPVILGDKILTIFNYGTAIAYFATVLVAIGLLSGLLLILGGAIGFLFFGEGKFSGAFSFEKFMGFRFLMAKRTGQVVSLITVISVFAVVVGCAGMVVVMSVMDGFSSDLRQKILGTNAHLVVMKYGNHFKDYRSVLKKTASLPGVVGSSPYILNEVMISSESNISGAVIKGIDVSTVDKVSSIGANITEGAIASLDKPHLIPKREAAKVQSELKAVEKLFSTPDEQSESFETALPGIVIGVEMAKFLRLSVGSPLTVVSPIGEMGPTGPIPKAKAFRVAAIFFSGMYEYDSKFVYISLAEANSFFVMNGSVSGIEYKVSDLDRTVPIAAAIKDRLGGYPYYTRDWMQMNRNLFSALKLEKIAMFIILVALIFMASLLILVALVMVVMEKGKEIAILKSIGVTDLSVMKIFVTYGLTIGSTGAILGVALHQIAPLVYESNDVPSPL